MGRELLAVRVSAFVAGCQSRPILGSRSHLAPLVLATLGNLGHWHERSSAKATRHRHDWSGCACDNGCLDAHAIVAGRYGRPIPEAYRGLADCESAVARCVQQVPPNGGTGASSP